MQLGREYVNMGIHWKHSESNLPGNVGETAMIPQHLAVRVAKKAHESGDSGLGLDVSSATKFVRHVRSR